MTAPATMQSKEAMWGHRPLARERSGAMTEPVRTA